MNTDTVDPTAIMAAHEGPRHWCGGLWRVDPLHCLPYQLARQTADLQTAVDRVTEIVNQYAMESDPGESWSVETTEPEDVWRLFRDLRAAGVPRAALDGAQ